MERRPEEWGSWEFAGTEEWTQREGSRPVMTWLWTGFYIGRPCTEAGQIRVPGHGTDIPRQHPGRKTPGDLVQCVGSPG